MAVLMWAMAFVAGQNAGNGEETGLHDGIDAVTHTGRFGDFVCVDDIEANVLVNHVFLHITGQGIPDFFGAVDGVEQED